MDAANIDLKAFSERFYHKLCFAHLDPVLDVLLYLRHETNIWLEITTLLIPGENDSQKEMELLCAWVMENLGPAVPLHFTAFHPDYKMLNKSRTPGETLSMARVIGKQAGLHHVYTGNVHDPAGGSTYCANCDKLVIERDWYKLGNWHLTHLGECSFCGEKMAGRFNDSRV